MTVNTTNPDGQNKSSAVMQQRQEARDALDDFPTPPWATRALCEWMNAQGIAMSTLVCREPCANRGYMVAPLEEYFRTVLGSDVHDYGAGFEVNDYLFGPLPKPVDFTITNPPFRLASQFIDRALEASRMGVAVIVRSAFLEGVSRYNSLFKINPPSHVLQFTQRVVMHKGKVTQKGSTATAYAWLVWLKDHPGPTTLEWIPPCRQILEKDTDYVDRGTR